MNFKINFPANTFKKPGDTVTISLRLGDFTQIEMPNFTRNRIEIEDGVSIPGLIRYGSMRLRGIRSVRLTNKLKAAMWRHNPMPFDIVVKDTRFQFSAFVSNVFEHKPIDGVTESDVELQITGKVTHTTKEQAVMTSKKPAQKIRNKFYVAHNKVHSRDEQNQPNEPTLIAHPQRWTRATLKDAVAHAEAILEANPHQEEACVVQIIRRVRRRKLPMIVETVR